MNIWSHQGQFQASAGPLHWQCRLVPWQQSRAQHASSDQSHLDQGLQAAIYKSKEQETIIS